MDQTKKDVVKKEESERDSYEEMFKNLNINEDKFIEWGFEEIKKLLPPIDQVRIEWDKLSKKIKRKEPIEDINATGEKTIEEIISEKRASKEKLEEEVKNIKKDISKLERDIKVEKSYKRDFYKKKNEEKKQKEEDELKEKNKVLEDKSRELEKLKEPFVFIRGYGRNKQDTEMRDCLQRLYNKAGFNIIIEIDKTNNKEPINLMNRMHEIYWKLNSGETEPKEKERIILKNYKLSHIWGYTKNICLFNCPWNIMLTPYVIDPFTGHESADTLLRDRLREKIKGYIKSQYGKFRDEYNEIWRKKKKDFLTACETLEKQDKANSKKYEAMKKEWTELRDDNMFMNNRMYSFYINKQEEINTLNEMLVGETGCTKEDRAKQYHIPPNIAQKCIDQKEAPKDLVDFVNNAYQEKEMELKKAYTYHTNYWDINEEKYRKKLSKLMEQEIPEFRVRLQVLCDGISDWEGTNIAINAFEYLNGNPNWYSTLLQETILALTFQRIRKKRSEKIYSDEIVWAVAEMTACAIINTDFKVSWKIGYRQLETYQEDVIKMYKSKKDFPDFLEKMLGYFKDKGIHF